LRAAAKNYPFVTVITDPEDYSQVISEMKASGGSVSESTNFRLAQKVFQLTHGYDGAISRFLSSIRRPEA